MVTTPAALLDLTKLAEDLGKAAENAPKEMDKFLVTKGNEVYAHMMLIVPVDTGRLKSSIAVQASPGRVVIGPVGVEYSAFVEFGTRPHVIKAKSAGRLTFTKGGKKISVKEVKHPGTRAQPYARPSAEHILDKLGADAAQVGVEMITGKVNP